MNNPSHKPQPPDQHLVVLERMDTHMASMADSLDLIAQAMAKLLQMAEKAEAASAETPGPPSRPVQAPIPAVPAVPEHRPQPDRERRREGAQTAKAYDAALSGYKIVKLAKDESHRLRKPPPQQEPPTAI